MEEEVITTTEEEEKDNTLEIIEEKTVGESQVVAMIDEKAKQSTNVKDVVDLLATRSALTNEETVEKIVDEKGEELRIDAESKRIKAETERINEEVKKVLAEKEKQIAEYDRQISAKKKEIEELKILADKEDAFFECNKEILKYINVRSKKTLGVMKALMFPATVIFVIVQILLFPINLCGLILECIVSIIGGICGAFTSNALKIIIGLLVVAVVVIGAGFIYYFCGQLIFK